MAIRRRRFRIGRQSDLTAVLRWRRGPPSHTMATLLVRAPISRSALRRLAAEGFGDFVKDGGGRRNGSDGVRRRAARGSGDDAAGTGLGGPRVTVSHSGVRHPDLAAGQWGELTLSAQLANIGSEVGPLARRALSRSARHRVISTTSRLLACLSSPSPTPIRA